MSGPTKAELQTEVEAAYEDFIDRATKAQLSALLDQLGGDASPRAVIDPRMQYSGPTTTLVIRDPGGYIVTFDLIDRTIHHAAAGDLLYEDAIAIDGDGPVLTVDLQSTFTTPMNAMDFSPHPTVYPIPFTYSVPKQDEEPSVEIQTVEEPVEEEVPEDEHDIVTVREIEQDDPEPDEGAASSLPKKMEHDE